MFNRIRAIVREVVEYLIANPGVSSFIAGEIILFAARVGFHVTMAQLSALAALLVPFVAGGHVVSHRIRSARAAARQASPLA